MKRGSIKPVKRSRGDDNVMRGHPELEETLKKCYIDYGWVDPENPRLISQSYGVTVLPEVYKEIWSGPSCCDNDASAEQREHCLFGMCRQFTEPRAVSFETLELVHTRKYLNTLQTNRRVLYDIFDIEVAKGPLREEDKTLVLDRVRQEVGCVIVAAAVAYVKGTCVTLQGGHHHAAPNHGEGRGMLADVPVAWLFLRQNLIRLGVKSNPRALYVDVDVHHANGFVRCRKDIKDLRDSFDVLDLYNESIWPIFGNPKTCDTISHITYNKPFRSWVSTADYLSLFRSGLNDVDASGREYDIVFYMCSNDALTGDPLGQTRVSAKGIKERDNIFMQWVATRNIPVVLLPSRGYGDKSCKVIRESMEMLQNEFQIY